MLLGVIAIIILGRLSFKNGDFIVTVETIFAQGQKVQL